MYKVFSSGGFDVVVGNPPYIEDKNYDHLDLKIIKARNKNDKNKSLLFNSRNCGNTHAYFTERSIKVLKNGGFFGFIVPLSLVSTDRMGSIREFIHNNSSEVKYFNFDDGAGKIFSGLEHCRATIVITRKDGRVDFVTTSKYHRWYTRDRPKLLKNLKTCKWKIIDTREIIPKIGTELEIEIIQKLNRKSEGKSIRDFIKTDGVKIWYHNAPQYWIHAHFEEYLPKTEYYEGYKEENTVKIPYELRATKISSHYKSLTFDERNAWIVCGLLNSSLFYWWFVVWSDGRDLLTQHITTFPIDLDNFPKDKEKQLRSLGRILWKAMRKILTLKLI